MFKLKWLASLVLLMLVAIYMYIFLTFQKKQNNCATLSLPCSEKRYLQYTSMNSILAAPTHNTITKSVSLPGSSHQVLQRRAIRLTRESRYLVQSKLRQWRDKAPSAGEFSNQVDELLSVFSSLTDLLEVNLEGLARVEGAAASQRIALQRLTDAFNAELQELQNPADCTKAKHLVMDINKECGFGCQFHHAAHCFRLAIATGRVLHLISDKYKYSTSGFSSVFQPLTSCSLPDSVTRIPKMKWGLSGYEDADYVYCPIVEQLHEIPKYSHPAVPASIADTLAHLHGAPAVWVSGHLLGYLMRLRPGNVSESIEQLVQSIRNVPVPSPVVGIHVRRTDKINTEAAYHKLEEYMYYVDQYFDKLESERLMRARSEEWRDDDNTPLPSPITRRVVIATDDPKVIEEAHNVYKKPRYEIIGDFQRAQSASPSSRHGHSSLLAVVTDVFALSYTDYIVCTFSSQICRLAYELMQTHPAQLGDASMRAQSLDDDYYYGGQQTWYSTAIVDDKEIGTEAGDLVACAGNQWNGYARIILPQSRKDTFRPAYKFEKRLMKIDFPEFRLNVSIY